MNRKVRDFQKMVIDREEALFNEINLYERLSAICSTKRGLVDFGEAFYFIRYKFYKLNFIIGTRSSPDEAFWGGLVANLLEELGGTDGVSHNELYRIFLREIGASSESELVEPFFTPAFNNNWEKYAFEAPFQEALAAIAVYEILDNPDYQLMLRIAQNAGVTTSGLEFFLVHAGAVHFELFEDFASKMFTTPEGEDVINRSADYVHQLQSGLWKDLLIHLENKKN